jgi:hypothetical protein
VTSNGRHGYYTETWTLAADRDTVESWQQANPVPPEPDTEG